MKKLLKGKNPRDSRNLERLWDSLGDELMIAWYPSAGSDFKDVFELSRNSCNLKTLPNLFVHTDYKPNWEENWLQTGIIREITNGLTTRIKAISELVISNEINYHINPDYVDFPNDAPDIASAFLLDVSVTDGNNRYDSYVIYFIFENINFLDEVLLMNHIKISHLVKVREGCAWGGNKKSISIVYAFILNLGVQYLIIDKEEHTDSDIIQELETRHDLTNYHYELNRICLIDNWSGLAVNVFEVIGNNELLDLPTILESLKL